MKVPVRRARIPGAHDPDALADLLMEWVDEIEDEGGTAADYCAFVNLETPGETHVGLMERHHAQVAIELRLVHATGPARPVWEEMLRGIGATDPPGAVRCFFHGPEGTRVELLETEQIEPLRLVEGGQA